MSTHQPKTNLKTPDKGGIKFPSGHILVNEKWKKNELVRELSKRIRVAYSDALGFIDFYITEDYPVVYITESDLKNYQKECKERISKLKSIKNGKGVVIVTWNSKCLAEFSDIQEYAVLDLGLFLIPVACQSEVPAVLNKLVMHEIKSPQNPRKGLKSAPSIMEQVSVLTKIPGVGDKEAKLLLQTFGNIVSICEASKDTLKCTIGEKLATQVFGFFNRPIT